MNIRHIINYIIEKAWCEAGNFSAFVFRSFRHHFGFTHASMDTSAAVLTIQLNRWISAFMFVFGEVTVFWQCLYVLFKADTVCLQIFMLLLLLGTTQICIVRTSYGNVSGWVAVCHSRYCIKTTKPILNFFDRLVAPLFEHLGPLTPIPNSKGNPFIRGI